MTYEQAIEVLQKDIRCCECIKSECLISDCHGCENHYAEADFREAVGVAIEALEKQTWIPCSERMPEEFTMVLVDVKGYVCTGYYGFKCKHRWFMEDSTPFVTEPKAWMPLPEPYEED